MCVHAQALHAARCVTSDGAACPQHTVYRGGSATLHLQGFGAAAGAAAYAVFRHRCVVSPARVHAAALQLLREDAAVTEILAAPLAAGRGPVASVVTGGQFWLQVRGRAAALVSTMQVVLELCALHRFWASSSDRLHAFCCQHAASRLPAAQRMLQAQCRFACTFLLTLCLTRAPAHS